MPFIFTLALFSQCLLAYLDTINKEPEILKQKVYACFEEVEVKSIKIRANNSISINITGTAEISSVRKNVNASISFMSKNTDRPNTGDLISFCAIMNPNANLSRKDNFFAARNSSRKIWATGIAITKFQTVGKSESWSAQINRLRNRIVKHILNIMHETEESKIVATMIAGDKSILSESTKDLFRKAGMAHILAISGLHMSATAWMAFHSFRKILSIFPRITEVYQIKKIASFLAIICGGCYLIISGSQISATRAFGAVSLVCISIIFDKSPHSITILSNMASIITIIMPFAPFSPGFQMSFAAVSALLWIRKKVENSNFISACLKTSLVTSLATAPFSAYHFGSISISGVLSNIIAIPVASMITIPFSFITVIISLFGLPTKILALIAHTSAKILLKTAEFFASFSFSEIILPEMPNISLIMLFISAMSIGIRNYKAKILLFSVSILISFSSWNYNVKKFDIAISKNTIIIANDKSLTILQGKRNANVVKTIERSSKMTILPIIKNEHCSRNNNQILCDMKSFTIVKNNKKSSNRKIKEINQEFTIKLKDKDRLQKITVPEIKQDNEIIFIRKTKNKLEIKHRYPPYKRIWFKDFQY